MKFRICFFYEKRSKEKIEGLLTGYILFEEQ